MALLVVTAGRRCRPSLLACYGTRRRVGLLCNGMVTEAGCSDGPAERPTPRRSGVCDTDLGGGRGGRLLTLRRCCCCGGWVSSGLCHCRAGMQCGRVRPKPMRRPAAGPARLGTGDRCKSHTLNEMTLHRRAGVLAHWVRMILLELHATCRTCLRFGANLADGTSCRVTCLSFAYS